MKSSKTNRLAKQSVSAPGVNVPFWTSGYASLAAAADDESAVELMLYGDIGESWWADESITAKFVREQLSALTASRITVRINSHGGAVSDALAIFNTLRDHPAAISVVVDGVAMSAASLVAMAADEGELEMAENSMFMVHAPWTMAAGNAAELRKAADVMDQFAAAMVTSYTRSGRLSADEATRLLTDGEDHYYTASEALAAGLIDRIGGAIDVQSRDMTAVLSAAAARYRGFNSAAAAVLSCGGEAKMTTKSKPDPNPSNPLGDENAPALNVTQLDAVAAQRLINDHGKALDDAFGPLMASGAPYAELVTREVTAARTDLEATPDVVRARVLKAITAAAPDDAAPVGGSSHVRATAVDDARDKFRRGAGIALAHRVGAGPAPERGNEFRGMPLWAIASKALAVAGHDVNGLTRREIATKVLAMHTTSDFPNLLLDAGNKRLQAAYSNYPSTWRAISAVGETPDFKTINFIRLGSFNSLATIPEGKPYTQGTIPEEKETATPATKGRYILLTRQMIVNDDLNGFSRLAQLMGRAAGRTVNEDVYGIINANAAMSDGVVIFHADHSNLAGSGGAISVATVSAGRAAMRKQTFGASNATEYLNIMPRTLLVPVVKEDLAREVISSDYDTDTAASRKRNPIRDWGPLEVVSDPVLDATSATAWYLVADPNDAPLIEVHFLDGVDTPFMDTEVDFMTDAIAWKVRLDYAVGANDYRGGYKNAGA